MSRQQLALENPVGGAQEPGGAGSQASFQKTAPFEFRDLPGAVFQLAILQHVSAQWHCRTLDRLHLAAMKELGLRRLLTNDAKQAAAARALGYEVVSPGV
jgi:hypothetical protein